MKRVINTLFASHDSRQWSRAHGGVSTTILIPVSGDARLQGIHCLPGALLSGMVIAQRYSPVGE